jgi:hypothetical protein
VVTGVGIELDNPTLFVGFLNTTTNGKHASGGIPNNLRDVHDGINEDRLLVFVILHKLDPATLIRNQQARRSFVSVHLTIFEPTNGSQLDSGLYVFSRLNKFLQATHFEWK